MKKLTALLGCFVLMLAAGTAFASSGPGGYPSGPIQVVVTFSAGAATDFQARIATQPAQKYFGQPMVIQNMPGAGGMTGWNWVIDRGSRDGLTMTTYNMPHTVAQSLVQAASNFTVESWQPIANFGSDPAVLVVPVGSNIQNVADFVSFAKANPRRLTVNGAGLFVGHHVATLQLQQAADIQVTYVPEQGAADALASLYGNASWPASPTCRMLHAPRIACASWPLPTRIATRFCPIRPPSWNWASMLMTPARISAALPSRLGCPRKSSPGHPNKR